MSLVIVLLVAAALVGGAAASRMAWRMRQPIPEGDRVAIERAFEGRGPRAPQIDKRWVGGPWQRLSPHLPISRQVGRPYKVRTAGGSSLVVINGVDSRGDPVVRLRDASGWKIVHKRKSAAVAVDEAG
jgi:hypothetical protein